MATLAYLLPFLDYHLFSVLGFQLFLYAFPALTQEPSWSGDLYLFVILIVPPVSAVAGFFYRRKATWMNAVTGAVLAALGLVGLALGYFYSPRPPFAVGYYAAECGFLLATIAAALRLIRLTRVGVAFETDAPDVESPAMSASQELLQRYRLQR